jgi:hypothetical protein
MRDDELKNLVDELLYLVEVGSGSPEADEAELAHLLDRLALGVRHGVDPGEPEVVPEVPARNIDVLQKVAASRLPQLVAYNRPASVLDDVGRGATLVASPAHDLASIADHLHVVAWLWREHDWDTGLWYLHDSHRRHWGLPMRGLQLYLHARERRAQLSGSHSTSPRSDS